MKRFLLITLAILGCLGLHAHDSDYRPFIEEGKVWKVGNFRVYDMAPQFAKEYYFGGDTIVGDQACKRWMCRKDGVEEYVGAVVEKDKRVLLFLPESEDAKLLYDFGLSAGDTIELYNSITSSTETCTATHILSVNSGIHSHRCIRISESSRPNLKEFTWNVWMEGIGTKCSPLLNLCDYQGMAECLMECSVNGNIIYEVEDNPVEVVYEIINKSYRPLVEEGKRWTFVRSYDHPAYSPYNYWYYLHGDTVIGGQKCLKMFSENYNNDSIVRYVGSLYEEDKKVYAFLPEHDTADLLYDFDCDVDDEIRTFEGRMLVTDIVQEEYDGNIKRYYHLLWLSDDGNRYIEGCKWIEGIGGCLGFFETVPGDGNPSWIYRCEVNGEILYQTGGQNNITSPSSPSTSNPSTHPWADLSGRRLTTPPTRPGVYIKDGRKVMIK